MWYAGQLGKQTVFAAEGSDAWHSVSAIVPPAHMQPRRGGQTQPVAANRESVAMMQMR